MNEIFKFRYQGISPDGGRVQATVEAANEQEAYRKASASGVTVTQITRASDSSPTIAWSRTTAADIAAFTRELSVLLEARIPLARGLVSIAENERKPALKAMVRALAADIEAGSPLTDALSRHREHFGEIYIETIRAAEKSGNMSSIVAHLAEMLDRQMESRQQLRRTMTYPAIVLAVVAMAVGVIFVFVVPRFAATFEQQGVQLPLVTRVIQAIGESIKSYWYAYLGTAVAFLFGLLTAWRSPTGRPVLERTFSRVPYFGRLLVSDLAARFARVLSIGLGSGMDLIETIEICGRASGSVVFRQETQDMADKLRGGAGLSDVMRSSRMLPSFARRMLSAGKDSAEVAKAGSVVAAHFERECTHMTKNINTVIEPILTVVLAGIVLVVALSVFLPMWQMIKVHR